MEGLYHSTRPGAMRRHPIIVGCAIIIAAVFVLLMVSTVFFGPPSGQKIHFFSGKKVALVEIKGVILESGDILDELEEHRKNSDIRAVVVRIDSPGGAVGPSQEIYSTLKQLDQEKPVIASMGSVAASGGYYIALGARKIIANPGTVTGSIGVIVEISNIEDLMKWAKVRQEVIKSGPYKDIGSPFRSMTDEERQILKDFVGDVYDQFVTAVEKSRKIKKVEVLKLANGMIYTGKHALDLKLIDQLGTINDAIKVAAKEAGIEGEPEVVPPIKRTFLRQLMEGQFKGFENIIPWEGIRVMYLFRL